MNLIKSPGAQCGTVAFFKNGQQPHVPVYTVPITITAAGELLIIVGRFVLSDRPDSSQNYPGFLHPYFAAGGLFLTAQDPTQMDDVSLSSGFFLDKPSGEDGWMGGGTDTSPMHPYTNDLRIELYLTTTADVGQRWITMLTWASSSYAGSSDYLLNETMQGELAVADLGGATLAVSPPAPLLPPPPAPVPPPSPPVIVVSPPAPPPPPAPAPVSWLQSLYNYLLSR